MSIVSFIKKHKNPFFIAAIGLTQAHCAIDHSRPFITVGSYDHSTGQGTEKQLWLGTPPGPTQDDYYRQPAETAEFRRGQMTGYVTHPTSEQDGGPEADVLLIKVVDPSQPVVTFPNGRQAKESPLVFSVEYNKNPSVREGLLTTMLDIDHRYFEVETKFAVVNGSVQIIDPIAYHTEGNNRGQEYGRLTDALRQQAELPNHKLGSYIDRLENQVKAALGFGNDFVKSGLEAKTRPHQDGFFKTNGGNNQETTVLNIGNGQDENGYEYHKYRVSTDYTISGENKPLHFDTTIKFYPDDQKPRYVLRDIVFDKKIQISGNGLSKQDYDSCAILIEQATMLQLITLQQEVSPNAPLASDTGEIRYGNAPQVKAPEIQKMYGGATSFNQLQNEISADLLTTFNNLPPSVKQAMGFNGKSRLTTRPAQPTGNKGPTSTRQAKRPATGSRTGGESQMDLLEKAANGEIRVQFGPPAGYQAPQPK